MGIRSFARLVALSMVLSCSPLLAADTGQQEAPCPPGSPGQEESGMCGDQGGLLLQLDGQGPVLLQQPQAPVPQRDRRQDRKKPQASVKQGAAPKVIIQFFWGRGCPHCEQEKRFLEDLKRSLPNLEVRDHEVWYDRENAQLLASLLRQHGMTASGVPVTFVGDRVFSGFTAATGKSIAAAAAACAGTGCSDPAAALESGTSAAASGNDGQGVVDIPGIGSRDVRNTSLLMLTLVIAGLDSFNPCAFFVLFTLLGLLVHARSRNRMFLIGTVFVFFSGFIYFLFMAAWLNLFLFMGQVALLTTAAGSISLLIASINIKDFFAFKQGVSLTIPERAKPGLFDRMRRLLRSTSLPSILIGTTVLAVVANSYELLCTAGFPLVFTRILTLNSLSAPSYYLYLALYNVVYVLPLLAIVTLFTATLGSRKLTEWQGRVLKLVSGCMMFGLGLVLLIDPALLNSVLASFLILAGAIALSLLVAAVAHRIEARNAAKQSRPAAVNGKE